jgi:hypothetical protein
MFVKVKVVDAWGKKTQAVINTEHVVAVYPSNRGDGADRPVVALPNGNCVSLDGTPEMERFNSILMGQLGPPISPTNDNKDEEDFWDRAERRCEPDYSERVDDRAKDQSIAIGHYQTKGENLQHWERIERLERWAASSKQIDIDQGGKILQHKERMDALEGQLREYAKAPIMVPGGNHHQHLIQSIKELQDKIKRVEECPWSEAEHVRVTLSGELKTLTERVETVEKRSWSRETMETLDNRTESIMEDMKVLRERIKSLESHDKGWFPAIVTFGSGDKATNFDMPAVGQWMDEVKTKLGTVNKTEKDLANLTKLVNDSVFPRLDHEAKRAGDMSKRIYDVEVKSREWTDQTNKIRDMEAQTKDLQLSAKSLLDSVTRLQINKADVAGVLNLTGEVEVVKDQIDALLKQAKLPSRGLFGNLFG